MYAIGSDPIDLDPLIEAVRTAACGAVVTFLGVVRANADDGRPVSGLSYESYTPLALAEMRAIGDEAHARFNGARVAIAHRLGELDIGETSVAIAAAAAHRAAAFDACEYAIDELKKRVPIWKSERYRDGDARWLSNAGAEGA